MPTNVQVQFKKKVYNASTDNTNGTIVFDNTQGKIYVGGECFSSNVKDASYNSANNTLTITKSNNTTLTVSFGAYESTSNKVTTLSTQSTDTQYPSAKCVFDNVRLNPVVVWEASTVSDGYLAAQTDITQNPTWQITNLDMTGFKMVEVYIRAGGDSNINYTSSVVIEIGLDDLNKSPLGHFIGSALVQNPNDRNRMMAVTVAISEDKTSVLFSRCDSIYGTAATSANSSGRVMYKIIGYYD